MDTWRTNNQDVQIRLHVDIVRLDLGPPAAPVCGLPLGLQVLDDHALVSVLDHLQKIALGLLRAGRQDRPRLDSWKGDGSTDWSVSGANLKGDIQEGKGLPSRFSTDAGKS